MKPALWFLCGGVVGAMALLAQDGASDWAERFAAWTATRNLDAPVRNAIHLRQTVNVTAANGAQLTLYAPPAGRRLALQQVAAYCVFSDSYARLDHIHVASLASGIAARYPILRATFDANYGVLAGPLHLYADPQTPVLVTLGFSQVINAVCEVTGTGYLAQLNP